MIGWCIFCWSGPYVRLDKIIESFELKLIIKKKRRGDVRAANERAYNEQCAPAVKIKKRKIGF